MFYEDHPELLTEEEEEALEEELEENFDTMQWAAEMKVEEAVQPVLDRFEEQLSNQQAITAEGEIGVLAETLTIPGLMQQGTTKPHRHDSADIGERRFRRDGGSS